MNDKSLRSRIVKTEPIQWKSLQFIQQEGFKEHSTIDKNRLKKSLLENGFALPFNVWVDESETVWCLDGYHRVQDLKELETEGVDVPETLPANFIDCQNKQEAAKLVLVYSSFYAKVREDGLMDFMSMYELPLSLLTTDMSLPEIDIFALENVVDASDKSKNAALSLKERFVMPPFSILDARQGYWQERKRKWHDLGIESQETREEVELIAKSGQSPAVYELRNKMRAVLERDPTWEEILAEAEKRGMHVYSGASIFDPVLCEVLYKWFCPDGALILDPFAGGSVRGIVAEVLGYQYHGIDLREEQVIANFKNAIRVSPEGSKCLWFQGDSNIVLDEKDHLHHEYDFVFSCPPYFDLEEYSDDPADLSNMDYDDFLTIYYSIIKKSIDKLKDNRFACFVVGDIRDEKGNYRNFVSYTIEAFRNAGMELYNEIILVNVAGSLPVRIGRQFGGYRKVGKMHQNVLVFYKGDPKAIKDEFPEIKVEENLDEYLHR